MTAEFIRVVAPATLDENFTFDVLLDGAPFTVIVPKGGVTEGEEFEVPYSDDDDAYKDDLPIIKATMSSSSSSEDDEDQSTDENDRLGAPYGNFRVSLCSCCDVVTQTTFWMALCCFPVLVAQLLTRLRLKWDGRREIPIDEGDDNDTTIKGHRGEAEEENSTFLKIVLTFVGVLTLGYIPVVGSVILLLFYLAMVVWIGGNLRRYVRRRYRISKCSSLMPDGWEDRCTMCFCGCCAMIQLARHTHDDKEYPGSCWTTTGLEVGAPSLPIYNVSRAEDNRE